MADDDEIKKNIVHGRQPNPGWFQKGKSGNPRGRPKKREEIPTASPLIRDGFLKAANSLMRLTENGKELSITQAEAVDRAQVIAALKGNSHAQRNYQARHDQFRQERLLEVAKDHESWRLYISVHDKLIKDLTDRGDPSLQYYPHPSELSFPDDDFVRGYLGRKPIEGSALRSSFIGLRDVFLLQAERDRRHFGCKFESDVASCLIGFLIDGLLPEFARLDETALMIRFGKQRGLRKRELEDRLAADWAKLGSPQIKDLRTFPANEAGTERAFQKLRDKFGV